jgi:hypothetical protein
MSHSLMLLGTHSSAGKSLLVTAFCRILARRGVRRWRVPCSCSNPKNAPRSTASSSTSFAAFRRYWATD